MKNSVIDLTSETTAAARPRIEELDEKDLTGWFTDDEDFQGVLVRGVCIQ